MSVWKNIYIDKNLKHHYLCHRKCVNRWERNLEERELVICFLRPPGPFLADWQCLGNYLKVKPKEKWTPVWRPGCPLQWRRLSSLGSLCDARERWGCTPGKIKCVNVIANCCDFHLSSFVFVNNRQLVVGFCWTARITIEEKNVNKTIGGNVNKYCFLTLLSQE